MAVNTKGISGDKVEVYETYENESPYRQIESDAVEKDKLEIDEVKVELIEDMLDKKELQKKIKKESDGNKKIVEKAKPKMVIKIPKPFAKGYFIIDLSNILKMLAGALSSKLLGMLMNKIGKKLERDLSFDLMTKPKINTSDITNAISGLDLASLIEETLLEEEMLLLNSALDNSDDDELSDIDLDETPGDGGGGGGGGGGGDGAGADDADDADDTDNGKDDETDIGDNGNLFVNNKDTDINIKNKINIDENELLVNNIKTGLKIPTDTSVIEGDSNNNTTSGASSVNGILFFNNVDTKVIIKKTFKITNNELMVNGVKTNLKIPSFDSSSEIFSGSSSNNSFNSSGSNNEKSKDITFNTRSKIGISGTYNNNVINIDLKEIKDKQKLMKKPNKKSTKEDFTANKRNCKDLLDSPIVKERLESKSIKKTINNKNYGTYW